MSTLIHFFAIPALILLKNKKSKYEDQILPKILTYKDRLKSLPLLSPSSLLSNSNVKYVLLEGTIGADENNCLKYEKRGGIEFSKKQVMRHIKINNSITMSAEKPKNNNNANRPVDHLEQKIRDDPNPVQNQKDQEKKSNQVISSIDLSEKKPFSSPNLIFYYKIKTSAIKNNSDDFFSFANNKLPTNILTRRKKSVPFFVRDYEDPSITIPIEGLRTIEDEQHALKFIDFYKKVYANEGFSRIKSSKAKGIKVMGVEEGQYVTILGSIREYDGNKTFVGEKIFDSRRKELERVEREERIVRNNVNMLENGFYLGCSLYIAYIIRSLN